MSTGGADFENWDVGPERKRNGEGVRVKDCLHQELILPFTLYHLTFCSYPLTFSRQSGLKEPLT